MKHPRFTEEVKSAWIAALESGKYAKGRANLKRHNCYCCLGVLAEICGLDAETVQKENSCGYLTRRRNAPNRSIYRTQVTGLTYAVQVELANLNDAATSFDSAIRAIKNLEPLKDLK